MRFAYSRRSFFSPLLPQLSMCFLIKLAVCVGNLLQLVAPVINRIHYNQLGRRSKGKCTEISFIALKQGA